MKIAERIMETHPDSALHILQRISHEKRKSKADRALYGLLLFQALDKNQKPLKPDSILDFSIYYYIKTNDNPRLASCYFYKGRMDMLATHYEEASNLYLKALDCCQDNNDYALLGKIYSDLGDICFVQSEYIKSREKYQHSINYFNLAGEKVDANYRLLSVGRTYYAVKDYANAQKYFYKVFNQSKDSILLGAALQEIGANFYFNKQFDSAQYYLSQSIRYPSKGNNYAIRCFTFADLFFDKGKYDSAYHYAAISLKHPANIYTRRDCYRILVNVEYKKGDAKQMGIFMTHYQSCADSIRELESQTKATVLESIHNTTRYTENTKQNVILIGFVWLIISTIGLSIGVFLYKRNTLKGHQLDEYKKLMYSKQEFVSKGLISKIEETKALQAEIRKDASPEERNKLDKELYDNCLHLNNWELFTQGMNHAFNHIVNTLQVNYPSISHKEIIWCCLHLLDIPHTDKMLLLDATSEGLYKQKQRLAHRMNLKTTKELDSFLKEHAEIKSETFQSPLAEMER